MRRAAALEIIPDMIARPRHLIFSRFARDKARFFSVSFYTGVSSRLSPRLKPKIRTGHVHSSGRPRIHSLRTVLLKQRRSAASPSISTSTPHRCHFSSGSSTDTYTHKHAKPSAPQKCSVQRRPSTHPPRLFGSIKSSRPRLATQTPQRVLRSSDFIQHATPGKEPIFESGKLTR